MHAITRLCRLPAFWAWLLFVLTVWAVSCTPDEHFDLRRAHLFIGTWDVVLVEDPAAGASHDEPGDEDAFTLEIRQDRRRVELRYRGRTLSGTLVSETPGLHATAFEVAGDFREGEWAWTETWSVDFAGVTGLPPFGVFRPDRLFAEVTRDGVGPQGRFTTRAHGMGLRPE
jgi:hypothetical protein